MTRQTDCGDPRCDGVSCGYIQKTPIEQLLDAVDAVEEVLQDAARSLSLNDAEIDHLIDMAAWIKETRTEDKQ